jgi:hypothetical protein
MNVVIDVPEGKEGEGLRAIWEGNFEIYVSVNNEVVSISANKDGLVSLARHLLHLSQDVFPVGRHWHFDSLNSLEEGSCELTIDKR